MPYKQTSNKNGQSTVAVVKVLIWIASLAAGYFLVHEIKQRWSEQRSLDKAGAIANKTFDELRDAAAKNHPDQSIAIAVQQEAIKRSEVELAKETGDNKSDAAAGQFLGFYLVNMRARSDYCKALGLDISPFTSAFERNHASLYIKSRLINSRGPFAPDRLESEMYKQLLPTFEKTIADEMRATASELKVTEADVCKLLSSNGEELAVSMQLSTVNPALSRAMIEAR